MSVASNIILPFVGVTFDSSRAFQGPATMPVKHLIIGQKLSGGSGAVETPLLVTSADEVGELAGFGSDAHRRSIIHFANNKTTDTYIILLDDAGGASKASTDIVLSGTATAPGELVVYIDGDRYAVGVASGDTAATVAASLDALINANPSAPVDSSVATATVTLAAKNGGIAAGDVDVRYNYNQGEVFPAGITAAAPVTTPGTVDPDVQDAIDGIGDLWFNVMTGSINDATNLGKLEDYMDAQDEAEVQKTMTYYFAKKDTRANLITFSTDSARNNRHCIMIAATNQPSANGDIAAFVAGRTSESIQDDPAVPLHRMAASGLLPKLPQDRWTLVERNQLAVNGIATLTNDNGVQTEATVTMYLKNSAGAADIAWQYQNTVFINSRLRYTFVNRINTKYPRAKLADSAERIRAGQQVITPDVGKAEAVAWFLEEEAAGQVENIAQFKNDVVCQRSTTNPNRLEWILPPDLINQFIVGSGDLQFLLQSPSN